MKMTVNELEEAFKVLMRFLRSKGISEVDTAGNDFYWTVGAWLSFDKVPELMVGSLDDDIGELLSLLSGEHEPTGIDLERFAACLKLVSEKL